MMEPRLTSSVMASALIRLAETQGGFGAVLQKGDPTAGALIVILNEKGRNQKVLERILQPDGDYLWEASSTQATENEDYLNSFLAKRRKYDPDLWLIELDVASAERFAAEMNGQD